MSDNKPNKPELKLAGYYCSFCNELKKVVRSKNPNTCICADCLAQCKRITANT